MSKYSFTKIKIIFFFRQLSEEYNKAINNIKELDKELSEYRKENHDMKR